MAITSRLHVIQELGEVRIGDWQSAGLLMPSAVKPVFSTIEHALIEHRIGSLDAATKAPPKQAIGAPPG